MKITFLTYGSEGDVQPFVELGKGLIQAGHQVTLAAPRKFEFLTTEEQIKFIALPWNPITICFYWVLPILTFYKLVFTK